MRVLLTLALLLWPLASAAQETAAERTDRGVIVAFLEDNLSGAGRQVTLRGFAGALSSRATATQLTIADDQGVWLTLNDIVLDWSRSALLTGQVQVTELSAAEIILDRLPVAAEGAPAPEAAGFALPDLPVSVQIDKIASPSVQLGPTVLGQPVTGSIEAALSLAGGSGSVDLSILRADDGPAGQATLKASYASDTAALSVDLAAREAAGGLAATLLDLPGAPAVDLQITGAGPLTDFEADILLASDGTERLSGTVTLMGATDAGTQFQANLGGDLAPLFLPQYQDFLGNSVSLTVAGQRNATGRITLSDLRLQARALDLQGSATIAADGLPEAFDLTGSLGTPEGTPVLVPGFDTSVSLRAAQVALGYDVTTGETWRAVVQAQDLVTAQGRFAQLGLRGSGRIARLAAGNVVGGSLAAEASGLVLTDRNLAMVLGDRVSATTRLWWQEGTGVFRIGALEAQAGDLQLSASGEIGGLAEGFATRGRLRIEAGDLAPLSGYAGRAVSGRGSVTLDGAGSPLGGDFDLRLAVQGENLAADVPQLDAALRGTSAVSVALRRDTQGTTLRSLSLTAPSLAVEGSGTLTSTSADLDLQLRMDDLARLGPGYGGGLAGTLTLRGPLMQGAARIEAQMEGTALRLGLPEADGLLTGRSQLGFAADLKGSALQIDRLDLTSAGARASASGLLAAAGSDLAARVALDDLSLVRPGYGGRLSAQAAFRGTAKAAALTVTADASGLRIGQAQADRLLTGASKLSAALRLEEGALRIDDLRLTNPQITATAAGRVAGSRRDLDLSARLANLGLLLPEFPGPVTLSGRAVDTGSGYDLALTGTGPGQIDARLTGRLAPDLSQASLALTGSAQAGLANPFLGNRVVSGPVAINLRLNGPLALSALSGSLQLTNGRLADPGLPFSLEQITAGATLASGRAQVTLDTAVSSGGRVSLSGPVSLTAPYTADLTATLGSVVLRDPQLYETLVNGQIRLNGPLTGGALISGRLSLPQTELRVAATGFGGASLVEDIRHIGDSASARETRRKAGLMGDAAGGAGSNGGSTGRPFGLNVEVSAPNQVFVRGRGLDAELGGTLRLTGTTRDIVPSGAFNLIRGRLDILGRRLTLSEATLQLEGNFDAALRVVASSVNDSVTSSVVIEGSVQSPEVTFASSPQLPQEEVVSQLLFGRRLESLSAFQALQLANAVATLAGRGGDGIISRLRQGFGLDDLDVQTDANGNAQLTAGKYLSENVYSEVIVDQQGKSTITLNLDLSDSVTVRAKVGAEGETGLGLFYEKDY